ncbi:MAG: cytochrome P450 [Rhodobacteraceae bacterium]|nr:cytochrome P450 [Paracoccaceae bacterium]
MLDDTDNQKRPLNLLEEFLVMILNEQTGYFYQVSGWTLNCAAVGAILADLSLRSRIDTDESSLIIVDGTKTGESVLDFCLEEIANGKERQTTRYWIEMLATHSENLIDSTLKRLVQVEILNYHSGGFYTMKNPSQYSELYKVFENTNAGQFIKLRIGEIIFTDAIPNPRDSLVMGLLNVCDVIRFIFDIDEELQERIELVCGLELINRAISASVQEAVVSPRLRKTPLTKKIPSVPLFKSLGRPQLWDGNIPALFAGITEDYGPVFQLKVPFRGLLTFISGPKVNKWVQRNGRRHLTSGSYFRELEDTCGASGLVTSLDGADHFRLRKVFSQVYTTARFHQRIDDMCQLALRFLKSRSWQPGQEFSVRQDTRLMINMQMTQILVSTDTQDIFDEVVKWKETAAKCLVGRISPRFLVRTPKMKRRFRLLESFVQQVEQNHTPTLRAQAASELADDLLSLHESDPQFLPEQNLLFMLTSAPILQSMYVGDVFGFTLAEMARQPAVTVRIREEASNLICDGKFREDSFSTRNFDVTRRFLMECLRLYPVVTMQVRNVANSCVVEDFSLPLGERVHIVQTAGHYMSECFPEPYKFDIDRYLPSRGEHRDIGYCPYGLGTHTCNGFSWAQLQLILNILMVAYYFEFETQPSEQKLRISPFPTMSVTEKYKIRISKQLHEMPSPIDNDRAATTPAIR